jgi:hypothetical protein
MAVESLLVTIINKSGITLTRQDENNFDKIFDKANQGIKKIKKDDAVELPYKTVITNKVHKLRNGACHSGNIPGPEDNNLALGYTEEFLKDTFELCFDKAFDEVFLADIIEYPEISKYFKEAEVALEVNDLNSLTVALATSFTVFNKTVTSELPGWLKPMGLELVSTPFDDDHEKTRAIEELVQSVSTLRIFTLFLSLGATLQDLTLFIEKFPVVNFSVGGNVTGLHHSGKKPTVDECVHLMNALYNMILAYQSNSRLTCQ